MIPIITFSGSSQTGKTTLGRQLAQKLNCKFVSFGDYVREEAKRRGIVEPSREYLQNLGQDLVETDIVSFCRAVLATAYFSPGERLIVDGVRHAEALAAISTITGGQSVIVIHLHATAKTRESRSVERNRRRTLDQIDAHPVERQTNREMRQLANLVVDADVEVEKSFSRILDWLRSEYPELVSTASK